MEYFSVHFSPREIGMGLDQQNMEDLIEFLEYAYSNDKIENITTRALSILFYNDSKQLENLMFLCSPLLLRAQKKLTVPNFNFPERSYPDTIISGKIIFEYKEPDTPLINAKGLILNLPLESADTIAAINTIT